LKKEEVVEHGYQNAKLENTYPQFTQNYDQKPLLNPPNLIQPQNQNQFPNQSPNVVVYNKVVEQNYSVPKPLPTRFIPIITGKTFVYFLDKQDAIRQGQ
jgi:hypothetical protein